jgi:hypothetical protein
MMIYSSINGIFFGFKKKGGENVCFFGWDRVFLIFFREGEKSEVKFTFEKKE